MFAVIGRGLFYEVAPTKFGNLGRAFFTLFQLITLDDWFYLYSDVVQKDPGNQLLKVVVFLEPRSRRLGTFRQNHSTSLALTA